MTFPVLRTAMLAGGLLAFALSFDEIIVTTFTAGAGDAADLDLHQLRAAEPAPDRQRRRPDRDRHLARPGLGGTEAAGSIEGDEQRTVGVPSARRTS